MLGVRALEMGRLFGEGQCNRSVKRLGKKDVMERTENPLTPHQKNTTGHCWPQRWGREPPTREKVAPGNWEGGEMVLPRSLLVLQKDPALGCWGQPRRPILDP